MVVAIPGLIADSGRRQRCEEFIQHIIQHIRSVCVCARVWTTALLRFGSQANGAMPPAVCFEAFISSRSGYSRDAPSEACLSPCRGAVRPGVVSLRRSSVAGSALLMLDIPRDCPENRLFSGCTRIKWAASRSWQDVGSIYEQSPWQFHYAYATLSVLLNSHCCTVLRTVPFQSQITCSRLATGPPCLCFGLLGSFYSECLSFVSQACGQST